MKARLRRGWTAIPIAAAMLVGADQAAYHAVSHNDGHGHANLVDASALRSRPRMFPALRALLFQIWFARIDADLNTGKLHKALRHAREAMAFAPDLPEARILLASVLGFDLAAREFEESRRLAWIAEGLRVIDAGLERDPTDAALYHWRGKFLANRADSYPEFAEAFLKSRGVSVLDAACDSLVEAAEYGRGTNAHLVLACWSLKMRGERELKAAKGGAGLTVLRHAMSSFERCAGYASELAYRIDARRADAVADFRLYEEYAEVSALLCAKFLSAKAGEDVSKEEIQELILKQRELLERLEEQV